MQSIRRVTYDAYGHPVVRLADSYTLNSSIKANPTEAYYITLVNSEVDVNKILDSGKKAINPLLLTTSLKDIINEYTMMNFYKAVDFLPYLVPPAEKNKDIFRVNDLNGYYSIIKNTSFSDKKIKKKFKVNSFTLDQLIFDKRYIKKVDFIKIDTEGAEYEILTKSIKTIKKFKPIIYCEITRKKNMIFNLLKKNGYDFFTINKGRALNFNKQNFNGNILAIQKNSQLSKKERWPSG